MEKLSMWSALWRGFYSKRFYQFAAQRWRLKSFVFMFMIAAILWVPFTARMVTNFDYFAIALIKAFTQQIPTISINNGQASTSKAGVFYVTYPGEKNQLFAVIDMQSKYKGFATDKAALLLAKNGYYIKTKKNEITFHQYNHFWPKTISTKNLVAVYKKHHHRIMGALFVLIYLVGLLPFYVFCCVYWTVVDVFAGIVASGLAKRPPARAILAVGALACYPVLFLGVLLYTFLWMNAVTALLLLVIQVAYIVTATYFLSGLTFDDESLEKGKIK